MSEQEWLEIFGDNLQSILEEYGLSQRDLADEIGVSESTISKYIHKKQMPNIKAIVNIVYALDIEFDDLIDFGSPIE